jgi:hypothetical protein
VAFQRQHHQPRRATMTFDGVVKALALHGKGARVVVCFAVDQQNGFIYLICLKVYSILHHRKNTELVYGLDFA